nr:AAA family ATPase [Gordonia sp. LAM0048]
MAIVPVFVSSTFCDFHGERDVLVGPVRERLDEMVRDLGCRVEMIDLRWGVDTLGVDEDEAARRVVDVCLAEVRRSRPLFLGLIGDRVGYIPDAVHARWVADSVGVPADQPVEGHSVTELEFGFGMLWPSAPTGEHVVLFREVDGPAPEGWRDPDTARLTAFRQQIESRAASTTRYLVTLAPEGAAPQLDRIITDGPSASFEDLLVDRLSGPVRRRAEVIAARAGDASSAAERLFRDDHRQAVGRGAMIHDVTARIAAGQRVVLTGESGSGKSTVLCAAEDQLRAQGAVVIGVLLGATAIGGSARRMVEVLAQRLAPVLGRQLQVPEDASADALVEWWRQIVTETAARETRLVLVVDTLDALTEAAVARDVWPIRIAASALRVLCSTTSDDQAHALAASGFAAIRVDKLDGAGAAAAAQWWSKQSGRALPRPVMDVIAAEPRSPLWVRLAVDLLADLDADDFARIAGDDDQATALANLLLAEVRDMHSETDILAGQYLTRVAERIGSDPSHVLLGVLATAHSGMAPADLAQALGRYPDGSRMVAVASRILGSQLRQADETGRLRFAHQAVQQVALVAGPVDADKRIVEVLDTDRVWDDADALDVIWHAIAAVPTTSSAELNGLAQTFARALDSRPHSAERVLAHALDVEPAGVALIECLADNGISLAGFGPLLRALAFADARHIDKQSRVRFAEAVLETTRRVAADGVTREVLWGLINLADTLESAGEKSRVAPLLDEALRLARLLRQQNSTLVRPVRDLIMCLEEVADRRTSLGDIASAQPLYKEALELARWLWKQTPHDAEAASDLSNALTKVAGMRRETGDLGTASAMLEESLALRRQLHTAQPGSLAAAGSLAGALAKAGEMALTHGNIPRGMRTVR